jgi:hypothetical protein
VIKIGGTAPNFLHNSSVHCLIKRRMEVPDRFQHLTKLPSGFDLRVFSKYHLEYI